MIKKLALLLLFLCGASFVEASVPITCSQFKTAVPHNFVYTGFTGTGPDIFAMGYSDDFVRWFQIAATWPTCNNGATSPCPVNSPSSYMYTDSTTNDCHIYGLIAEANDLFLNSTKQDIAVLSWDGSNISSLFMNTIATLDWSTIPGTPVTVFAGRFDQVPPSNCVSFTSPVTFTSGFFSWTPYRECVALTPTSVTVVSGPTALSLTGVTNGVYDTQVIANPPGQSVNCVLLGTQTVSGLGTRSATISSGSCSTGSYTFLCNAASASCPLYLQNNDGGLSQHEGSNYLQSNIPNNWYFYDENIATHSNYSFTCLPGNLQLCQLSQPVPWVPFGFPSTPRAGTIMWMGNSPTNSTAVGHGTFVGSGIIK